MVEHLKNGDIQTDETGTHYTIHNKTGVRAVVVTHSGDTCTVDAQGQRISVGDNASILSRDLNSDVFVPNNSGVNTMSFFDERGQISENTLDRLIPNGRLDYLLQSSSPVNSPASYEIARDTLHKVGVNCTDPHGQPSTPVLSVSDVRKIADGIAKK